MDAPQERRRYPRVKVKIPVELHLSAGTPQRTSIEEISVCGCYIETMFTFEVSTRVDLVIWLNQEKVTAKGIVVNRYPQVGNGIDFVTMAPQDRLKLSDFISKSSE